MMGHSQGGMVAPRIAQQWSGTRRLILRAAPARSLLLRLPEQNRRLFAVGGQPSPEAQAQLTALDTQIAAALGKPKIAISELPFGVPQSFWKSIDAVDG